MLNDSSGEKWVIKRLVQPFGEKTVATSSELKQLKGIHESLGEEFERDDDVIKMGGVYLFQFIDDDTKIEYNFFQNDARYIEYKNDEVVFERWYESNEKILLEIQDLYKRLR